MKSRPLLTTREEVLSLLPKLEAPPEFVLQGIGAREYDDFISRIRVAIPPEMKDWLSICNGAPLGAGGVYGVRPDNDFLDIESRMENWPVWGKSGWLPVAGDGCGNVYSMVLGSTTDPMRPVVFIDTSEDPDAPAYAVASGLWTFLRFFFEEDLGERSWPFSRTHVLRKDPDLGRCRAHPLPWMT